MCLQVYRLGLDWNTIQLELERWKNAQWALDTVLNRMTLKSPTGDCVPHYSIRGQQVLSGTMFHLA